MAPRQLHSVLGTIRRMAGDRGGELTDRELLQRFTERREQEAFETLVRRHGPLVLGVCRRLLRNDADAEDAFQATFLVLARKAPSICWHESIGNWLYGVACRVARKARTAAARRSAHERRTGDRPREESLTETAWQRLQDVLDEELQRLPDQYRAPLLLCCVQDHSQEEAARQLGCSEATVRGRLYRGRELLRRRLASRGWSLPAALAAVGASVSSALAATTAQTALTFVTERGAVASSLILLAEGTLTAMFLDRIRSLALVALVLAVLGIGAGLLVRPAHGDAPKVPAESVVQVEPAAPVHAADEEDRKADDSLTRLNGIVTAAPKDDRLIVRLDEEEIEAAFTVAADAKVVVARRVHPLADVQKGMRVQLTLSKDEKSVVAVEASWRPLRTSLKKVDATAQAVTVELQGDDDLTFDFTLAIPTDVHVRIGDMVCGLTDLREGRKVEVELSADKKSAVGIRADFAPSEFPAVVQAADPVAGVVIVRVQIEGEHFDRKVELAFATTKDVRVRHQGKDVTLADLKAGMPAHLELAADRKTVVGIRVADVPPKKEDRDDD